MMPNEARYDDLLQSENDDRFYRGLRLANNMEVVLISDPKTEKSAAALEINVGFAIDPPDYQGLAQLFQHLLYMSKNVQTLFFQNYVKNNDGSANAITQAEFATYYFDVKSSIFINVLGCFAKFFKEEYFIDKNAIEEEIENVTRELKTSKLDDKWKTVNFIKWIRKYHESQNTSEDMLIGIHLKNRNIKKILKTFNDYYFPSHMMRLCVLGKESLDELEDAVKLLFPNEEKSNGHKFLTHMSMRLTSSVYKTYYVPHEAYNKLHVTFYMHDITLYTPSAIDYFLSYLFKYDSRGSLLWALKARDWCTSIEAGSFSELEMELFISFDLTKEGLEHIDDIMILFFQYIDMLKESKDQEMRRVYNEYKEIQELKFRFQEKEQPLEYVRRIARSMHGCPMKHVLRGKKIPLEWKKNCVRSILNDFLSPLRISIYVASKKYENFTDSTDPCYNYNYKIEEVPAKTCAKWTNSQKQTEFYLPPPNKFIPSMFIIKPPEAEAEKFPRVIAETKVIKLWYKKDDEFNEPKAAMVFHFIRTIAFKNTTTINYIRMFVWLLNKSLSEYVYPAALVNLDWELCATNSGIKLKISGFDNKQNVFLEKIVDGMIKFKLNSENFETNRQKFVKINMELIEDFEKDLPYKQARYYHCFLLTDQSWEEKQILESCENISFEKMQDFISNFFSLIYVDGLIHGNITKEEALNIVRIFEDKLSGSGLPIKLTSPDVRLKNKLQEDYHYIFRKKNKFHDSSCTLVSYQINRTDKMESIKCEMILKFIQNIIRQPCFNAFRDTVGHIVRTGIIILNTMIGLIILIEHQNMYMHKQIEEKIDAFMHSMMEYITTMSDKKFEAIKTLIIENRHKPKTLNDLSNEFWEEIFNRQYNFERRDNEIKELDKLNLSDVYKVFRQLMDEKTPKLSIHVTSMKNVPDEDTNKSMFISRRYVEEVKNILSFRDSNNLNENIKRLDLLNILNTFYVIM